MIKELSRQNNINIIRFAAASMVIYGHMFSLLGVGEVSAFLGSPVATVGVKLFFIISGYLITKSFLKDGNVIRYGIRRFFRIMPGLIFLVLLTTFGIGPLVSSFTLGEYFSSSLIFTYLKNMFLLINHSLPGVFTGNPYPGAVNGSLWSLPVEVLMYMLFPLVVFACGKLPHSKILLCLATVCVCALRLIWMTAHPAEVALSGSAVVINGVTELMPYFFIGGLFTLKGFEQKLNLQIAVALVFVSMFIVLKGWSVELISYIILPYTVLSFAFADIPAFAKFSEKNDYSYGMYLYGFLVQQCVINFLYDKIPVSANLYFIICVVLTIPFAILSWHLIEKPAQRLGKRLLKVPAIAECKFGYKKLDEGKQ